MPPIAASVATAKQVEQLRQDGNYYFSKERFSAAIDAYTEAITLCPNVPVYWTNRALCHRKLNEWSKVEEDCCFALQLDPHSFKALDLGRGANPKGYMVEKIWQELAKAKYMAWELDTSQRSWDLQTLKISCEEALKVKHLAESYKMEGSVDEAPSAHAKQLEALEHVFRKAAEDDTPTEVPDYLCCKIALDIYHDPVVAPCGFTYERAVILDHLEKVGKFDPITREPLRPSQLIPNLAMKEAVQAYLENHGWAYRLG